MTKLTTLKTLVVKVGTSTLTTPDNTLDQRYISRLAQQLAEVRKTRRNVVLVTSGAIRAGVAALGMDAKTPSRQLAMPEKQAAAAVGQGLLMHTYSQAFSRFDQPVAQILLTRDDIEDRERFLNARNTFHTLFNLGVVPIVNENDTVAVDEIKFGDNDSLAALVTLLVDADLLILLTDVNGLYADEGSDDKPIPRVDRVTAGIEARVRKTVSCGGTGGMLTKLKAAKKVNASAIPVVIANGREPNVVQRILHGEPLGTYFPADTSRAPGARMSSRKRWIAFGRKPKGEIIVNEGARRIILERGKSLLPVGVVEVVGDFASGEMVRISEPTVGEFARGLVNYSAQEIRKIAGLRTSQIKKVLGEAYFDEVVHRDNLAPIN